MCYVPAGQQQPYEAEPQLLVLPNTSVKYPQQDILRKPLGLEEMGE